ncbi:MAG: GtrA family protein [Novosphingobium sp.]|nr:GtrA family protein [Novosphingobium sp.]
MDDPRTRRWRLRPGELGAIFRFGLVGIAATLTYLAASLVLLEWNIAARAANLIALLCGTLASYLGHYFFTYRADERHLRLGGRFVAVTVGLTLLCVALHHAALGLGASPPGAALLVALAYPPLSFALNHFWAFARGAVRSRGG